MPQYVLNPFTGRLDKVFGGIGSPVGGTPDTILFLDSSGNLSSSTNLKFTGTNFLLNGGMQVSGEVLVTQPLLGDLSNGSLLLDNSLGLVLGYRTGVRYSFGGTDFGQAYFEVTNAGGGVESTKFVVEPTARGTREVAISMDGNTRKITVPSGWQVDGTVTDLSKVFMMMGA